MVGAGVSDRADSGERAVLKGNEGPEGEYAGRERGPGRRKLAQWRRESERAVLELRCEHCGRVIVEGYPFHQQSIDWEVR